MNVAAPPQPTRGTTTTGSGISRFFADQTYHFETLRVFSEISAGAADTSEALVAVGQIREGDTDSWFEAWSATALRNTARAEACFDPTSRGLAWLRAHTYWRAAEFLLKPDDPRRVRAWIAEVDAFDRGLSALDISHTRFEVPYEGGRLRAIFYPGPAGWESKPLLVFVGGCDSILEEHYFVLAKAAYLRGYGVLNYEGPGQGAALRQHGLAFTPEWEKPTAAVLDAYLAAHPAPPKIVLVGDVFYDMAAVLSRRIAGVHANPAAASSPGVVWAIDNARWTLGVQSIEEVKAAVDAYKLERVAHRI